MHGAVERAGRRSVKWLPRLLSLRFWPSSFLLPGFIQPYWLSNIDCPGWEGATRRYVTGSTYKHHTVL